MASSSFAPPTSITSSRPTTQTTPGDYLDPSRNPSLSFYATHHDRYDTTHLGSALGSILVDSVPMPTVTTLPREPEILSPHAASGAVYLLLPSPVAKFSISQHLPESGCVVRQPCIFSLSLTNLSHRTMASCSKPKIHLANPRPQPSRAPVFKRNHLNIAGAPTGRWRLGRRSRTRRSPASELRRVLQCRPFPCGCSSD